MRKSAKTSRYALQPRFRLIFLRLGNVVYDSLKKMLERRPKQYLMGHSDAGVTLNVYIHASCAHAADQMAKISQFRQTESLKNSVKSKI